VPGEREAFDRLVDHNRPILLVPTFLRTRSHSESEDLVKEILLRAWRKLPKLHDPTRFLPWIKAIAENACSTWYRRPSTQIVSLDCETTWQLLPDGARGPWEILLETERQRKLHRFLLLLPKANRLALLMHEWGDYSYAEIALVAEIPVTTVDGRICRANAAEVVGNRLFALVDRDVR